jgi:Na+-translocating ferredoxin:NAD+ oxidoreductase RnfG subunit
MKTYMTLAIVAAVAVMLVASVAVATGDAFAGKKKYEKNQALSQANACGNGELPLNVFCSNSASQVQGDENGVSTASNQAAD